jgi:hypothetical protein
VASDVTEGGQQLVEAGVYTGAADELYADFSLAALRHALPNLLVCLVVELRGLSQRSS